MRRRNGDADVEEYDVCKVRRNRLNDNVNTGANLRLLAAGSHLSRSHMSFYLQKG